MKPQKNAPAKRREGMTLIELLVVIAVIGILGAIVLVNLDQAREQARASRMAYDLRKIEEALMLLAGDEGITQWWDDYEAPNDADTLMYNDSGEIAQLILDDTRLGQFLDEVPPPPEGRAYEYDNDEDVFVCGGSQYRGVNILIEDVGLGFAQRMDDLIDGDGSLNCGRLRRWSDILLYGISDDYRDL